MTPYTKQQIQSLLETATYQQDTDDKGVVTGYDWGELKHDLAMEGQEVDELMAQAEAHNIVKWDEQTSHWLKTQHTEFKPTLWSTLKAYVKSFDDAYGDIKQHGAPCIRLRKLTLDDYLRDFVKCPSTIGTVTDTQDPVEYYKLTDIATLTNSTVDQVENLLGQIWLHACRALLTTDADGHKVIVEN